jgi:hypothetical protein
MRAALAAAFLAMPVESHGQEHAVRDHPRSFEVFGDVSGYETFSPERFGTLASPRANELGFLLVLRMFRNVCLGLERGEALDAIMPADFAAYHSSPYFFGPDATRRGNTTVLSSTGDIEKDEDGGKPSIWLEPGAGGMTCTVEWRIAEEMSPESRQAIAGLISQWAPWELALVPASRPLPPDQSALSDAIEWDRPCQGRWCPATASYNLPGGELTMRMTLNIADIGGQRP